MKNLFLDIETLQTNNPTILERIQATLKPPGNMSKPETIAKWLADPSNLNEAIHKTALSGTFGRIACIGVTGDAGAVHVLSGEEGQMLADFRTILTDHDDSGTIDGTKLIGHNLLNFDLPFLSQRMMVHGLGPLIPFNARPWELNAGDTMTMFMGLTRGYISLTDLCLALGVPPVDNPIGGAQVQEYWDAGDHETVLKHCAMDLVATRECFHKMTCMDPASGSVIDLNSAQDAAQDDAEVAA